MPVDGSGGLFLSLLTESFAVRAFVGSLAAAALAALAVGSGLVRSTRARRLVILAPVLAAAVAGLASIRAAEAYLPQLWIAAAGTAGAAGEALDVLGDLRVVTTDGRLDLLVLAYGFTVVVLLTRRLCGHLTVRALLRRASPPAGHGYLIPILHRLARSMNVPGPRLVLLDRCPGGAFSAGLRQPVVALDPALLDRLDARELEGLLAHELAHIKRRDTLVCVLVGLFRDLTFFLPPVHLAVRWQRGEQEEGADELASSCTRRPVALASSILKVWDCSKGRRALIGACAALGSTRRVALASGGSVHMGVGLTDRTRAIAVRIERLIGQAPVMPRWRPRAELAVAAAVLLTASSAALLLPRWVASDLNAEGLAIGGLGSARAAAVESPAFATFRLLTDPATAAGEDAAAAARTHPAEPLWPTVETRGQLQAGTPAAGGAGAQRMLWTNADQDPWEVNTLRERAMPARPLWTLTDRGPQVGLFVLGRPSS